MSTERAVIIKRFWNKVDIKGPNDCWPWRAYIAQNGYGQFYNGVRVVNSHRFAWEIENESISVSGVDVCHSCDCRSCTNPAHLFVGNRRDNMQDASKKGRLVGRGQGPPAGVEKKFERNEEMRKLYDLGVSQYKIADIFGISRGSVQVVVTK